MDALDDILGSPFEPLQRGGQPLDKPGVLVVGARAKNSAHLERLAAAMFEHARELEVIFEDLNPD